MATNPLAPGCARANAPYRLLPFEIGTPAPRLPASLDSLAAAECWLLPSIQPAYPGHGARMAALLALSPRTEIEDAIEALLATLDACDGDPDAEDADPAGTGIDFAEGDDARFNYRPHYGKNQTRLPLNCKAMNRDFHGKVMAGLRDDEIAYANRAPKGFLPGGAA